MKLFAVILCAFIAMPSWAEDAMVSERATCDEIQAQIAELSGVAEPDESVAQEIAELKSENAVFILGYRAKGFIEKEFINQKSK